MWFQGTLVALAAFSEGRVVDQLKSAALLTPVAYLAHITTPIGILLAKAFVGEVTVTNMPACIAYILCSDCSDDLTDKQVLSDFLGVAEFNPLAYVPRFLPADRDSDSSLGLLWGMASRSIVCCLDLPS